MKLTDTTMKNMLLNITDTGAELDPAALFLGVYTAVNDMGGATALSDITQATGDMATRAALATFGDPHKLNDGRWAVDAPAQERRPGDSSENQVLQGFFLASLITGGVLKTWEDFPNPVALADEFSSVSIIVRITVDPDGRWAADVIFNG